MKKVLFYTASNVASVVQYGGIGALEGSQDCIADSARSCSARRDLFYAGIARARPAACFTGAPPAGAFYAFLRIDPAWTSACRRALVASRGRMAEHLIKRGRIGCVPGVDFGANGEGYIRFCFARGPRGAHGRAGLDAAGAGRRSDSGLRTRAEILTGWRLRTWSSVPCQL